MSTQQRDRYPNSTVSGAPRPGRGGTSSGLVSLGPKVRTASRVACSRSCGTCSWLVAEGSLSAFAQFASIFLSYCRIQMQRGRGPGAPAGAHASKLAVPKPVNLPSLRKVPVLILCIARRHYVWCRSPASVWAWRSFRLCWPQENAGNDPSTQIVPVGNNGGWTKPESAPSAAVPDTREVPLAATSTWGSTAARSAAAPWQPPDATISAPPALASELHRTGGSVVDRRRLNPAEYPSLDAAATAKAALAAQLAIRSSALVSRPRSQVLHLLCFVECPSPPLLCRGNTLPSCNALICAMCTHH